MALERGPFVKIPDSALPAPDGSFDNETWVTAQLADLPGYLDEIAAAIDVIGALDLSDFAPEMDDGLVDALIGQAGQWFDVLATRGDQIDGAAIQGDSDFADALDLAPEGTWNDNPQLYQVPAGVPSPSPSGGTGVPAPGQTGIHFSVTPPPGYTFTLINNSNYGANAFTVGDQFLINATGPGGVKVSVLSALNGSSLGSAVVGNVLDDGTFKLSGYESPTEVGAWVQEWYVGDQLVAIVDFSVLPSS